MTDTPKFGPKLDLKEHKLHVENFDAEMYEFTNNTWQRDKYVNVLHISTDLNAARPEMDRVIKFMKRKGYKVEIKHDLGLLTKNDVVSMGIDTDMLIIGSDVARHSSAYYLLWFTTRGWFGLIPYHDILWYGIDYKPEPSVEWVKQHNNPCNLPLFSDCKFSWEAICAIHAYIRRRNDRSAAVGVFIDVIREIEGHINELVCDVWKMRTFEKFDRFKTKVMDGGYGGPDVELFFAALDVLRHSRNVGAHLVRGIPPDKVEKELKRVEDDCSKFDILVTKHKFPFPPPRGSSEVDAHSDYKWQLSLARIVSIWLEDYSKHTSPRT